jgi:hypothetical protein
MRYRELVDWMPDSSDTCGVSGIVGLWAVRRDWPDGEHEFVAPRATVGKVARALAADRNYWRRGPLRPALSVVRISHHDFELHATAREGCRAPDCPTPDSEDVGAGSPGGV